MTADRDHCQSFASARALVTLLDRIDDVTRTAALVRSVERQLEQARSAHERALADHEAADAAYMATPYCDDDDPMSESISPCGTVPDQLTLELVVG